MAKTNKTSGYVCSACGANYSTWSGRCSVCGEWNSIELNLNAIKTHGHNQASLSVQSLEEGLKTSDQRMPSGMSGVDQVFGGGIVNGSVNLISGEPGMGKSTLLLQLAAGVAQHESVLYVSGEESLNQVAMRARRLGVSADKLKLAATNSSDEIKTAILSGEYKLVIVDSIQTIRTEEVGSSAGSITQVTNSARLLTNAAKASDTAVIIVGHVTKEGSLAGPRLLEHIVDVVLSLEGDNSGGLKLLRVSKNRFGSVSETAIFEMKSSGLSQVDNPSKALLAERKVTDGSIVLATIEGSRPILVEVQALVNPTGYGYPKRAVSGLDLSRLNLLVAMMEKRTSLKLNDKDIYVNIVGGLKITEPAADLAVVMAIASASRNKKLKDNAVVFGEVGLSGEIRHVPFIERRLDEAKALGFAYAIGPKIPAKTAQPKFLNPVADVKSALNSFLS